MAKVYDIVAIVGSYEKAGEKKLKYRNVGMVNDKDGKLSIRLETPIVLDDDGKVVQWFNLYEPNNQGGGKTQDDDTDVPF